jgi:hypothetical protein
MKFLLYGYAKNDYEKLIELREVSILASSRELRLISKFLEKAAQLIDEGSEHVHLQSECSEWNDSLPDVVAVSDSQNQHENGLPRG